MKILKQDNVEKYGNDCMIYKTIALLESFGSYIVLNYEKVTGWCACSNSKTQNFSDYNDATRYYDKLMKGI